MVHGTLAYVTLTAPAFSAGAPLVELWFALSSAGCQSSLHGRIGEPHARLESVKHRFPERVVVVRPAAAIVRCQQMLPILRCLQLVTASTIGGTNPTATREFGEGAGKGDPRQLVTQWHRYAVKLVVHPQAQALGLRDLKTLVATLLEPGSEPTRPPVIDMRFHS